MLNNSFEDLFVKLNLKEMKIIIVYRILCKDVN